MSKFTGRFMSQTLSLSAVLVLGVTLTACAHAQPASERRAEYHYPPVEVHVEPGPAPQGAADFADPDAYAAFLKGRLAERAGDYAAAAEHYRRAAGLDPDEPSIWVSMSEALVRKGDLAEARAAARQAVKLDAAQARAYMLLGGIASAANDFDEAKEAYRQVIKLEPSNEEAYVYLSSVLAQERDAVGAEAVLKDLLKVEPESVVAYYYLGHLKAEEKSFAAAEDYYRGALKLQPRFQAALAELALVLEFAGKTDEALAAYQELLSYYPERADIRRRVGQLYIKRNDLKNAVAEFEALQASDKNNLDLRLTLGLIFFEQGDLDRALQEFQFILASTPDAYKVRLYTGAIRIKQKDPAGARAEFGKIPPAAAEFADAQVQLALLERQENKIDEATRRLTELTAGATANADAFDMLASLYRESENYERALAVLQSGLARFKGDEGLLYALGVTQDLKGEWEKAVETMREVLSHNPDHAQALNYIGYTYAEKAVRLDEAEQLVLRASALQPQDGYIMDSLGWVYYQKGEYQKAYDILLKARDLSENDPIVLEHIAETKLKLGKRDEAARLFNEALQSKELKPKDKTRIVEKVRQLTTTK